MEYRDRTELDAHRGQTFLCKISVQRALDCLIAKAVRFFNSKISSILKLCIILLTTDYINLFR